MLGNDLIHNGAIQEVSGFLRRKRKAVNCEECRRSKLRCDRQHPCGACKRRKRESICSYEAPSGLSASRKTRRKPVTTSASSALSGGAGSPATPTRKGAISSISQPEESISEVETSPPGVHWETVLERPVPEEDVNDTLSPLSISPRIPLQEMIDSLPPKSCCDYLVSHFFKHISALFPILHGPTFQKQYTAFMQRPQDVDLPWLALLFALCSLSLNTLDESDPRLACVWSQLPSSVTQPTSTVPITVSVSRRLLRTAITCLLQGDFLIRHTFSTLEALLMVIYSLSHNESVDQGWALLGMALNIGIALRCNVEQKNLGTIETERRRRCWAGLLTLHTYQGMLFRDFDMSYLLSIQAPLPADVNDVDITNEGIVQQSCSEPTQMSVMMAKLRLFRLSTQICRHTSGPSRLDQQALHDLDAAIAEEQKQWDAAYMVDGSPNILDSNRYAYWCVLQTYAHHLYLLLHRPFHHSKASCFLPFSRERCISSSAAMISLHRQLYEAPILRNYFWLLSGVISLKALHAAVALNSCLQDDTEHNLESFREEIESLIARMKDLSGRSHICLRAYRILRHLQAQAGTGDLPAGSSETPFENLFEDLTNIREWMDADLIDWSLDGQFNVFAP
ncbi:hypothetical protein AtubIFM55763_007413 [Aspergillus tubingensis]|uniref:Zn(2)-C6 fungal-type domain-containing protein n=1 Tax=Aspergillus tubingensis TaxID=5068 RepID=A0A9W6ELN0_ASPTU|nr:hypothetical protein AtubIFM54640_000081 [Aspergillus tubingensis]GLA75857.1 hypothetical protein AtubIFM55763_007413 [Aspergillus tubingensis]GLA86397.1 hypothetical protein AtubIFM56815_010662 [Aspergillus tubingensis]GLA93663.1 hypothetical protein AtubIFM57143_011263 [Aspergillus tubingensis]